MLVIRGNTRVADIYLGEYMRHWTHFHFRNVIARKQRSRRTSPGQKFLTPDDSWTDDFYRPKTAKSLERKLFSKAAPR